MFAAITARVRMATGILSILVVASLPLAAPAPARAASPGPEAILASSAVLGVSADGELTCAIRPDRTVVCWGEYGDAPQPPSGLTFTAVDAGYGFACGILPDRSIRCWGSNYEGQSSPPAGTYLVVRAFDSQACAVRTDHSIVCWGQTLDGQQDPPAGSYQDIARDWGQTCGLRTDGSLTCWLDDPEMEEVLAPPSGTFSAIDRNCAIRTSGALVCWDEDGSFTPLTGTFRALSGTCAIRTTGTIACWSAYGEDVAAPPTGTFAALTAGDSHACAIRTTGPLVCWGSDDAGQVSPRAIPSVAQPEPWRTWQGVTIRWGAAPALAAVTSFDVSYKRAKWNGTYGAWVPWKTGTTATSAPFATVPGYTYCFKVRAHAADGLTTWWTDQLDPTSGCTASAVDDRSLTRSAGWAAGTGVNYYRSTYLRSSTLAAKLTATGVRAHWIALVATTCPTCGSVKVTFGSTVRTISLVSPTRMDRRLIPVYDRSAPGATLATLTIKVASTGKNVIVDGVLVSRGEVGPAWADAADPPRPAQVSSGHVLTALATGGRHTCVIRSDKIVTCWGRNTEGQSSAPAGTFATVAAGDMATCAINTGGALVCWGHPAVARPPAGSYVAVSVGRWDACAIRADRTLACWGDEEYDEDYEDDSGVAMPPAGTFKRVSVGGLRACAIGTDDGLVCWGAGFDANSRVPTGTFTAVSVGDDFACAVRATGALACWGRNDLGQARPPTGTFTAVSAGNLHACAIRTGGAIACWGDNQYLESTPPAGTYKAIDVGEHHACAIRTNGSFACWGQNRSGQVSPSPTTTMTPIGRWLMSSKATVAWRATSIAAIASSDLRYRRAKWNGAFGALTTLLSATTASRGTFTTSAGYTYCWSARARDVEGRLSAWSAETCTRTPIDDRSLTRSTGWSAGTGAGYYRGTVLSSSTTGAKLTLAGVKRSFGVRLVATTCATCGTVKVYWGTALLRQVSLYSADRVDRKVIWVSDYDPEYTATGTLSIKVVSTGKSVLIDGVEFVNSWADDATR